MADIFLGNTKNSTGRTQPKFILLYWRAFLTTPPLRELQQALWLTYRIIYTYRYVNVLEFDSTK